MKVTREQMAEHRRKILDAAARLFRAHGFEAVTVAEVMQAAGLTHGGFYGHFKSKDELIAETIGHVLAGTAESLEPAAYAGGYLSARHRDNLSGGCPFAGLGAETIRQTPEARAAMTAGLKRHLAALTRGAPGATAAAKRRAAIGSWSAMVGALILSRFSDDPKLSDELLKETRAWIAKGEKAAKARA
ncbi:MAG TPA: TetR family transcriptional regulator [Candidatus Binatia bacterium]|nr:TetR family transcriptional regulator [Candidatus Binatia bacterium]